MSKVFLTDRAVSDLLGIESYSIETWGAAVAKQYLLKLEKAFNLITVNPDLPIPNQSLHESMLFFRVERHLLSCIKIKSGIAVLTIAHASRDLPNILHELSPTLKQELTVLLGRIVAGDTALCRVASDLSKLVPATKSSGPCHGG